MKNILKNIVEIRSEKGVKQEVLSEMLGISQNTLSQIETGKRELRYKTLSHIAKSLNMREIDIITYPDRYVLENKTCNKCEEKDLIIKNLNGYIKLLESTK